MQEARRPALLERLRERKLLSFALMAVTLSLGILIGTIISGGGVSAADEKAAAPDAAPLKVPDPVPVENQFTEIVRRVRPSVVNIRVESIPESREARGRQTPEGMEDFFRRFFGMPGAPEDFDMPTPPRRPGEGSGVVVDAHGYVMTNAHVVSEADRVRVRFPDDDEMFDARVIGVDEETDVAVIKVDGAGDRFIPAKLGNSDAVNVGDWAIAIGSPFGFRETVTVGIISAKSREVQGPARISRPFQKFFQTDAAINPGNSGGPLVNIRGEVVGINTAIVSRSGAYEGLGFSLPSNVAVEVYNQIIKHGRVARGSIGITFSNNQDQATLRVYGAEKGVFVTDVKAGGPADEAGMQPEDVIVEIDGVQITDGDQLIELVASLPVGEKVPVKVMRGGKAETLQVEIADRAQLFAEELGFESPEDAEAEEAATVLFGISVQELSSSRREQLGYDGEGGVLVTAVEPTSFSDDIGMLPNDVIVAINRRPVATMNDVREVQNGLKPGDDVAFKVMRRGPDEWQALYLAGVLPESGPRRF